MKKYKYIKIIKDSRVLLRIKIQAVPNRYNSHKGEVDIFIDAAKNKYFDVACLQTINGRVECGKAINADGFYDEREDKIKLPVINFKDNQRKIWCPRHNGVIKKENVFLFPICSTYIPADIKLDNIPNMIDDGNSHVVEINNCCNVRVDFFVLPKSMPLQHFLSNLTISLFYFKADITIFDKSNNGAFLSLPIKAKEDVEFKFVKINGWDTLICCGHLYTSIGETRDGRNTQRKY